MIIIETERLLMREFEISDAQDFFELNSDFEVVKYTGDTDFESIEAAVNFLKNYNPYKETGMGRWAVILKSSNEYLGWCGLKLLTDENEVECGFRFFKKYWGNGYATESALASLKYGFEKLNLEKITGRVVKENLASIKVLERIGMTFQSNYNFHGMPGAIYSIDKKSFLNKIENDKSKHS